MLFKKHLIIRVSIGYMCCSFKETIKNRCARKIPEMFYTMLNNKIVILGREDIFEL